MTGAGRGIGRAIALICAREGACGIAICARSEEAIKEVEGAILNEASSVCKTVTIPCDVGDEDAVNAMVDAAMSELGGLDILINNAGVGHDPAPFWDLSADDFDRVINVNLKGVRPHPLSLHLSNLRPNSDLIFIIHYLLFRILFKVPVCSNTILGIQVQDA